MSSSTATAPESTFRLGNVSATVWCNESKAENGSREFRSVNLEQRYRDSGGEWQSSSSFTLDQLLRLQVCIAKAVDHISGKEMESK